MIELKAPRGFFCLDPSEPRPAVLLPRGIGVTPMISMLRHVLRDGTRTRRLTLIQATRSTDDVVLHVEARRLEAEDAGLVRVFSFIHRPESNQRAGRDFTAEGHIDSKALQSLLPPRMTMISIFPVLQHSCRAFTTRNAPWA